MFPTKTSPHASVSPSQLLGAWLQIGLQSFGGGISTLTLIQRSFVQQRGWLTDADFVRTNAISQIAPGINLLSIALLIGLRLAGIVGAAVSLFGLLLPSVGITILMTAGYAAIRRMPSVQYAVHGIVPATIGIGLLTAWSMSKAMVRESGARGDKSETALAILVLGSSAAAIAIHIPVIAVLFGGGLVMAVVRSAAARRRPDDDEFTPAVEAAAMQAEQAQEDR